MADVFISYAREDREAVDKLAGLLEAAGLSCWWDKQLVAGARYLDRTEAELNAARAVLVVWTKNSVTSHWVADEAGVGRDSGRLAPISLDGSMPPLGFRQFQVIDFSAWKGGEDGHVRDLVAALAAFSPQAEIRIPAPAPRSSEPVLAVLAFDNLSGDPEMAFFSDGISDEILQAVSRGLRTIGRASSFQFRGADKAVRKVAGELGATHVLDGSVRKGGGMVRISAQLIDAGTQLTVWQGQYDRPARDLFAVQDEIAVAVAMALKCKLSPAPHSEDIDPETYEAFLRLSQGAADWLVSDRSRIDAADHITRRAPRFGRGWIEAGQARAVARRNQMLSSEESQRLYEEMKTALDRAASLLGEDDPALTAIVVNWTPWTGAWTECETRLRQALDRTPRDLKLTATLGSLLVHCGRLSEGFHLFRELHQREPLWGLLAVGYGMCLSSLERHEEAWLTFEAAARRWPENSFIWLNLVTSAAREGRWDIVDRWTAPELLARFSKEAAVAGAVMTTVEMHRSPDDPRRHTILPQLIDGFEKTGRLRMVDVAGAAPFCDIGALHDLLDRTSFAHLIDPQRGYEPGDWGVQTLFFAGARRLRADPRFVRLCARLGLVKHWIETGRWPDCSDRVSYDFRAEARRVADTPLG